MAAQPPGWLIFRATYVVVELVRVYIKNTTKWLMYYDVAQMRVGEA